MCCSKMLFLKVSSFFHILHQVQCLTSSCSLLSVICLSSDLSRKLLPKRLPPVSMLYFTPDFIILWLENVITLKTIPSFTDSCLHLLTEETNLPYLSLISKACHVKCSEAITSATIIMTDIFPCSISPFQLHLSILNLDHVTTPPCLL